MKSSIAIESLSLWCVKNTISLPLLTFPSSFSPHLLIFILSLDFFFYKHFSFLSSTLQALPHSPPLFYKHSSSTFYSFFSSKPMLVKFYVAVSELEYQITPVSNFFFFILEIPNWHIRNIYVNLFLMTTLLSWLYSKQKLIIYSLCTIMYVFCITTMVWKRHVYVMCCIVQWVEWFWLIKLASTCRCHRIHSSDYWINKMESEQTGNIRLQ